MKSPRNNWKLIASRALFAGMMSLSGCAELGGMSSENMQLHDSLKITASRLMVSPYGPVAGCVYTQDLSKLGGTKITETFTLHSAPVATNGENLFVTETATDNQVSSFLIDSTSGKLLDFKSIDPTDGQRYTPENATQTAQEAFANMPPARQANDPHYINGFQLFMPEFDGVDFNPNDAVANVTQEDGNVWATYVYRGITEYNGVTGPLFDLMRTDTKGTRLAGFMVFDTMNMTPLLSVLDSGTTATFTRRSCQ
jgi:hypothetical protein